MTENERSWKSPPPPPEELDSAVQFLFNYKEKGQFRIYEPDTMSSFSRSIQRFLDDNKANVNIMKDEEFKVSREVRKSKRSEERICWTHFWRKAVWRPWARASLKYLRVRWFLLTIHFGHQAGHEARQIKFGDIALRKNKESGEEYLEWTTERESKTKEFVYRRPQETNHRRVHSS